jgi:N-acetyl sugar amidotransferase
MPNTRPGLTIDNEGICNACRHYDIKKNTDWKERWKELEELADKYRNSNGDYYDCIITVSSGKDSYYQVYIFKEILKMHPLLVSVNSFSQTKTGIMNWNNLLNEFKVDAIQLTINPDACKHVFKKGTKSGFPTWFFDRSLYTWPLKIATQLNIPLVVYGENTSYEYGGPLIEETPSAINQINNDAARPIPIKDWVDDNISTKDFAPCTYPNEEEIKRVKLNPIYLSYYVPWSGYENMVFARTRGFKTLDDTGEWKREGYIEQYDQIDTIGYLVHNWFKFPKLGHYRTTDIASIWIREGRLTREEAVKLVIENDWKLDRYMLNDFLSFTGLKEQDFWQIVDEFSNTDILTKKDGIWKLNDETIDRLKNP